MFRFIKVFIVMYVFSLAFIVTVGGSNILSGTAGPIAQVTVVCAILWCWLKKPSRAS